jgi:hypothetical protein
VASSKATDIPHAPRLDPLRSAPAKLEPATARTDLKVKPNIEADRPQSGKARDQGAPVRKAPPAAKADRPDAAVDCKGD